MFLKTILDKGPYRVTFNDVEDSSGNESKVVYHVADTQVYQRDYCFAIFLIYLIGLTLFGFVHCVIAFLVIFTLFLLNWLTFQIRLHRTLQFRDKKLQTLRKLIEIGISDELLKFSQKEKDEAALFLKENYYYSKFFEEESTKSMLQGKASIRYKYLFSLIYLPFNILGIMYPFSDWGGIDYSLTSRLLVLVPFVILVLSYNPFKAHNSDVVEFIDTINRSSISPTTEDVQGINILVNELKERQLLSKENVDSIDELIKELLKYSEVS